MDLENQTGNEDYGHEQDKNQEVIDETQDNSQGGDNPDDGKPEKLSLHDSILKAEEDLSKKKEEGKKAEQPASGKQEAKSGNKEEMPPDVKVKPLEHWNDKQKTFFNGLPQEQQQTVLDMFNGIQKVYEKKTLEAAAKQKELSSIENVFKPYDEIIKAQGIDKAQYIGNLIEFDKFAASNPVGFLVDFMARRGINMDHIFASIQQYAAKEGNPEYKRAQKYEAYAKVLQSKIDSQKSEDIHKSIEQFKNAKDENDSLLYPHFETVKDVMAQISKATGKTDLGELYQKAIWLHPEVRKQLHFIQKGGSAFVNSFFFRMSQIDQIAVMGQDILGLKIILRTILFEKADTFAG